MNNLSNFIKTAMEKNAEELVLLVGSPVKIKLGLNFQNLSSSEVESNDISAIINHLNLNSKAGRGVIDYNNRKIKYSILTTPYGKGVVLYFQLKSEWDFPQFVYDFAQAGPGLMILAGSQRSGKSTAMMELLSKAVKERKKLTSIFSSFNEYETVGRGDLVSVMDFSDPQAVDNCDSSIIGFETQSADDFSAIYRLIESGKTVIATVKSMDTLKLIEGLSINMKPNEYKTLVSALKFASNLRVLAGLEQSLQSCFDLLVVNSQVQKLLLEKNYSLIKQLLGQSGEKTATRSMNQSLLQLLLKRKIDMKTAFQTSGEPEELDALLKKVGI